MITAAVKETEIFQVTFGRDDGDPNIQYLIPYQNIPWFKVMVEYAAKSRPWKDEPAEKIRLLIGFLATMFND